MMQHERPKTDALCSSMRFYAIEDSGGSGNDLCELRSGELSRENVAVSKSFSGSLASAAKLDGRAGLGSKNARPERSRLERVRQKSWLFKSISNLPPCTFLKWLASAIVMLDDVREFLASCNRILATGIRRKVGFQLPMRSQHLLCTFALQRAGVDEFW
jgi:hypothetical protein